MKTREKKFTEGPWRIELTDTVQNGLDILIKGAKEMWVGWVYRTNKPNGHLISAAPDLLEALEYLVEELPNNMNGVEFESAKKAIAKAYGDQEDRE
jgi:hypothetical protein